MTIRVAAVQLNSILGNVEANMTRALNMLEQAFLTAGSKPDLIVLPELALTGYNFKSASHIAPYLEIPGNGKSYEFGQMLSKRWDCLTLLGYPEKFGNEKYKIYNSAMLIDQNGKIIHNYRKTHLFDTDKVWGCSESPDGFQAFDLAINGKTLRTTIGICMDLNPYEFKAPFEKYEFATYAYEQKCQLILVPTAWMNTSWDEHWTNEQISAFKGVYENESQIPEINTKHDPIKDNDIMMNQDTSKRVLDYKLNKVDGRTGMYWVVRMNPFFSNEHPNFSQCVVVCNRSGMEDNLMYAGTSSMFTFHGGPMERSMRGMTIDFSIEGSLSQGTEGVLVRDLNL